MPTAMMDQNEDFQRHHANVTLKNLVSNRRELNIYRATNWNAATKVVLTYTVLSLEKVVVTHSINTTGAIRRNAVQVEYLFDNE